MPREPLVPDEDTAVATVRLPPSLRAQLGALAEADGVSVGEELRRLVALGLAVRHAMEVFE